MRDLGEGAKFYVRVLYGFGHLESLVQEANGERIDFVVDLLHLWMKNQLGTKRTCLIPLRKG